MQGNSGPDKRTAFSTSKKRMAALIGGLTLLFGVLVIQLAVISIANHEKYTDLATAQQIRDTVIQPKRGAIYDSEMNVLAESAACWTVFISPLEIKEANRDIIAERLSEILEVEYDTIYEKFSEQSYYSVIKRKVDEPIVTQIRNFMTEQKVSGIYFEEDSKRYYPNGDAASHLLGFIGTDNYGLAGLESEYDDELSGMTGRVIRAETAVNDEMFYEGKMEYAATDGYSLVLTVDLVIQHYLEQALDTAVREHNVQNGATGIIMNVKTGAILAMASRGGVQYDPNDPWTITDENVLAALELMTNEEEAAKLINETQQKQWKNKAITDLYEPGSVFKAVTASIALETGACDLHSSFECQRAYQVDAQTTMYCAITAHGWQTFGECLYNSCNPGFIQIGARIGKTDFYSYFKNFGLTRKTGIDLPGEAQSLYYTDEKMGVVELASVSYGQSNAITPIQMITAFSTVVNGGYLVEPHVVDRIIDSEGNIVESVGNTVKRQVISEETSATMRELLEAIITPTNSAYVAGYRVGGKSGTAEKLSDASTNEEGIRTFIASFCVFAPADDPEIAVLVLLDEAQSYSIYGTTLVGPIVAKIVSDVLPYIGIDPNYTEEELQRTDVGVPNLEGSLLSVAYSELQKRGLSYEVIGDGTNVTMTSPQAGFAVPGGSTVYLYTDPVPVEKYVVVPDVKGLSISNATAALRDAGLNIRVKGVTEGYVTAAIQNFEAETEVVAGTVVTVDFVSSS